MKQFKSFQGIVVHIEDFTPDAYSQYGCTKLFSLAQRDGTITNFIVQPNTYFINHSMISIGDTIIAFYDAMAPVPLIYPPRFRALVIGLVTNNEFVKVDYFNRNLLSSDGTLQLNIGASTRILLPNGQRFTCNLHNRNLIVVYSATTRSIPPQTTPSQVIVMCDINS